MQGGCSDRVTTDGYSLFWGGAFPAAKPVRCLSWGAGVRGSLCAEPDSGAALLCSADSLSPSFHDTALRDSVPSHLVGFPLLRVWTISGFANQLCLLDSLCFPLLG